MGGHGARSGINGGGGGGGSEKIDKYVDAMSRSEDIVKKVNEILDDFMNKKDPTGRDWLNLEDEEGWAEVEKLFGNGMSGNFGYISRISKEEVFNNYINEWINDIRERGEISTNFDWDGGVAYVMYKDGSYIRIDEFFDPSKTKLKKTNIVGFMYEDGNSSQYWGKGFKVTNETSYGTDSFNRDFKKMVDSYGMPYDLIDIRLYPV